MSIKDTLILSAAAAIVSYLIYDSWIAPALQDVPGHVYQLAFYSWASWLGWRGYMHFTSK